MDQAFSMSHRCFVCLHRCFVHPTDVLYVPQTFKRKPEKLNGFIGTKQKSTSQSSEPGGAGYQLLLSSILNSSILVVSHDQFRKSERKSYCWESNQGATQFHIFITYYHSNYTTETSLV